MKSDIKTRAKYELSVLAILFAGAAVGIAGHGFYESFVTFYLPDYSLGFCSRFLAGEIISLINPTPTKEWIFAYQAVNLVIAVVLASVLLGRYIASADEKMRKTVVVAVIFMTVGSAGIDAFSYAVGFVDIYWLILTIVSLFIIRHRVLKYFIPVFCLMGSMFHPVFPLTFFPLIAGLLLYFCCTENRRRGDITVLVSSIVLIAAASVYFFCFEATSIKVALEEFNAYLSSKSNVDLHDNYFTFYLFGEMPTPDKTYVAHSIIEKVLYMPAVLRKYISSIYVFPMFALSVLPIFGVTYAVLIKAFRRAKRGFPKLFFVLCLLAPLTAVVGCIYSTDGPRWISYSLMCEFGFTLTLLKYRDEAMCSAVSETASFFKKHPMWLAAIFTVYAAVYLNWL